MASTHCGEIQQLIDRWLATLPNEHTRRGYRYAHTAWRTWLQAQGVELLQAQPEHVTTWRATLTGSRATNALKASAVSSFYAYARAQGAVQANPVTRTPRPKAARPAPQRGVTVIQAQYLLRHAQRYSPRAHALLALVLHTGLPVSEALRIRVADLQLRPDAAVLDLSSTGDTRRATVRLNASTRAALEAYLGHRLSDRTGHGKPPDAPLFTTTTTGRPWDSNDAYRTIRRVITAAGLPTQTSPRDLRHVHTALTHDTEP